MSSLSLFSSVSLTLQAVDKAYGVKSNDLFRITSSFDITSEIPAYAMISGTVLLQQQTDVNKVNLILRPHSQKDFKLPVKYIIYRGLKTADFIENTNLTNTANKVKTSGSELLTKMQEIQSQRSPAAEIPVKALFGDDLSPAGTKNIDDFFFKNLDTSSQLFTIESGLELGNFSVGEIGIEIILENPEFSVTVEIAKKSKYEIDVSGITDAVEKKWKKDLVRHFADPAAFYGLHQDINGGIEYRNAAGKQIANTPVLVYGNIVDKFFTKNKVYLDIRNENGYSYNYYDNYAGTGTDADKNIKIGQTAATLTAKEYYTDDWAIHTIDVTAGTEDENEIFVALRIDDNKRPLLAGWNYTLINSSGTGKIVSDKNVYFADEVVLLGSPILDPLPDFTNTVSFKVPNVGSIPAQLATIVKLDYIKQLRINDNMDDAFRQENPTDFLFGPISTEIPWDSNDGVQWIGSNHYKYFDGLNHGVLSILLGYTVSSVDYSLNKLTVSGLAGSLYNNIYTLTAGVTSQSPVVLNIISLTENTTLSTTTIQVQETLPTGIIAGDFVVLNANKMCVLKDNKTFIIKGEDLSLVPTLQAGSSVWHHFKLDIDHKNRKYQIVAINFANGNTNIEVTTNIKRYGLGAIMESGIVTEQGSQENILFYNVSTNYFNKTGSLDTRFFNYKGGTKNTTSFLNAIRSLNPNFKIFKTTIELSSGLIKSLLVHKTTQNTKENILLLAITKTESNNLLGQSNAPISGRNFSSYHIKTFKLVLQSPLSRSIDFKPYYHYKLILSGLGTDGNYIETLVASGIDIYSVDGLVFSSDQYAQQATESKANYSLNFRRRSDYSSKGGHYGFDWMRPEYIVETDPIAGRGGICIPHEVGMTKQEAQDQLKQVYTPLRILNQDYYVPWLSLFKNHENVVSKGNPVVPSKHNVILDLEIHIIPTFTANFTSQDMVTLKVPEGISIVPDRIPASQISSTKVTVSCQTDSNLDRQILAYDQDNNLVGALNILQNDLYQNLNVRYVNVILKGTLTYGPASNLQIKINYDQQKSTSTGVVVRDVKFNMNTFRNAWKDIINNDEKNIEYNFFQSLISYKPIKTTGNNLDIREIELNFGNYTLNSSIPLTSPENRIKKLLKSVEMDNGAVSIDSTSVAIVEFINNLNEIYLNDFPNTNESITVFIFPVPVLTSDVYTVGPANAASNGFSGTKCVLLMNQTNFPPYAITHEFGHSLGLPHSFQEGTSVDPTTGTVVKPEHSFLLALTENIMDYYNLSIINSVANKISFWKWQILTMKEDNDLG